MNPDPPGLENCRLANDKLKDKIRFFKVSGKVLGYVWPILVDVWAYFLFLHYITLQLRGAPHSESKGNTKANRRQKQRRSKSKAKAKQKQRKNEAKANQKQSKGKAKAKLTAILRHHADEGCAGDFAERRQIPELYCNIVCALPQPRFLGAGRS